MELVSGDLGTVSITESVWNIEHQLQNDTVDRQKRTSF
jgi:hypothetical protein